MNKKTQPQALLESILPEPNEDEKFPTDPAATASKWPTEAEQMAHWEKKKKALDASFAPPDVLTRPVPRKWSLARRRKFNATVAKKKAETSWNENKTGWKTVTPPVQESRMKFCPCCGRNIERFLA